MKNILLKSLKEAFFVTFLILMVNTFLYFLKTDITENYLMTLYVSPIAFLFCFIVLFFIYLSDERKKIKESNEEMDKEINKEMNED